MNEHDPSSVFQSSARKRTLLLLSYVLTRRINATVGLSHCVARVFRGSVVLKMRHRGRGEDRRNVRRAARMRQVDSSVVRFLDIMPVSRIDYYSGFFLFGDSIAGGGRYTCAVCPTAIRVQCVIYTYALCIRPFWTDCTYIYIYDL